MTAHRIETVVGENGKLTVDDLPLRAGDRVEVIILLKDSAPAGVDRYPLRGKPYRFEDPFSPVAVEEWEAIR